MAWYVDIHPEDPQQRLVDKVVDRLRRGEVIAMPTDSGYAICCMMANKDGLERIRRIRQVGISTTSRCSAMILLSLASW